jgi:hypothetical protein
MQPPPPQATRERDAGVAPPKTEVEGASPEREGEGAPPDSLKEGEGKRIGFGALACGGENNPKFFFLCRIVFIGDA